MAIIFEPSSRRIILDVATISATELYSRSVDWLALSDNIKYGEIFRQVGGDDLGSGLSIPPYYFLQNTWRIRPMESSHLLVITGNLFVDGGGVPVVATLGNYNVSVQYTVPVQAQGISTSGTTGPTAEQIASAVWDKLLASHQIDGSAGKALATASSGGVDYTQLAGAVWNADADSFVNDGTVGKKLQNLYIDTQLLRDLQEGNWEIQGTQMVFFNRLGAEMLRYNLTDSAGAPSNVEVFKRTKI